MERVVILQCHYLCKSIFVTVNTWGCISKIEQAYFNGTHTSVFTLPFLFCLTTGMPDLVLIVGKPPC